MRKYLALPLALLFSGPAYAQNLGPVNPPYVQGPASATSGHVATFSGTSGKILTDGGAATGGTVTSVTCGTGLTGGAITTTGTCAADFGTAASKVAQGGVITAGGPTGSATVAPIITYNAAGQLTTVTSATVTPAIGSVTGLGTGVATALGNNASASGGSAIQTVAPTTWTPADVSGAALSFTSVSGNYQEFGNLIIAYAQWTYPATADGTGAAFSLPVAVGNHGYAQQCRVNYTNATTPPTFAVPSVNTANVSFYNSIGVAVTNANLSGKIVVVQCIYPSN